MNTELSVAAVELLFESVSVNVLVAPEAIVAGLKLLAMVGAAAVTVSVALAALGLLPRFVARAPAGILLVCAPGVFEVTATEIVQPPAGSVAPLA